MPTRRQTVRRDRRGARPVEAVRPGKPARGAPHPEVGGPDADYEPDPDADVSLDDEDDLTAQPHLDGDNDGPFPETGLSVDLEDLGRLALIDATQQDNFESVHEEDNGGMHVINPHVYAPPGRGRRG